MKNDKIYEINKKAGFDVKKMKEAAENGTLDNFINSNLSPQSVKKIKDVLSDKSAAEKLLSTPQAKELMKKLQQNIDS